jgi:hypothetical protein
MSQLKQNKIAFLIAIILYISLTACGTFKKEKTLKSDNLTVSYRSFNRLGPDFGAINPDHPVSVSEKQVQVHLLALNYKPFKARSKVAPVFTKDQIKEVSRLLTKGLNRADPQKFLHFELKAPKGMTEGDVFAADGYIHWRIWSINGVDYSNDPLGIRKKTWRLILSPAGHRYFNSSSSAGQKKKQNWIVADFDIAKFQNRRKTKRKLSTKSSNRTSQNNSKSEKPQVSNELNKTIKEKLILLKQLFDQGLINQEEYNKKKKEVMKRF